MTGRVFKLLNRPATLRQWSEESMQGALKAVQGQQSGLEFGVPLTMLKDRVSGRIIGLFLIPTLVGSLTYHGRRRKWILLFHVLGYGADVLSIVEATLCKKGSKLDRPITNGWWIIFIRVHRGDPFL